MNKRRLLKLAALLEADAKNKSGFKFALRVVAVKGNGHEFGRRDTPKVDCGTIGCAIGLACVSGAFKRAGLTYVIDDIGLTPLVGRDTGMSAAYRVFDLSENEGDFLFMPSRYRGAQEGAKGERAVAKCIRDFVAGKVSP